MSHNWETNYIFKGNNYLCKKYFASKFSSLSSLTLIMVALILLLDASFFDTIEVYISVLLETALDF